MNEFPDEVVEQEVPNGGSYDGELPDAAVSVVTVGITTTREVPTLAAAMGTHTVPPGGVARIGRDPLRRKIWINLARDSQETNADAVVWINTTEQQARSMYGFNLHRQDPPIPISYAGELWIYNPTTSVRPAVVGFLAEQDQA